MEKKNVIGSRIKQFRLAKGLTLKDIEDKAKVSATNLLVANASTGGFIGYVGNPKTVDRKVSLKGEILQTELDE